MGAFSDFWQASSLNKRTIARYAKRMSSYDADSKDLELHFPQQAQLFKRNKSKLQKLTASRKSSRAFSQKRMNFSEIAEVLESLATLQGDLEHRAYPSAGATYSVETFILKITSETQLEIYYYAAKKHGFVHVKDLTISQEDLAKLINSQWQGNPSALLLFVGFPSRVMSKYGERGNRFMLIEAGAMIQQVSLALSQSKNFGGYALGGLLDDELLDMLSLANKDAVLISGMLIGNLK